MEDLKGQVIGGLKWSATAKILTQIFSWVSTFFVIRMLTPEDYGLMALATVFFAMITLVTNNGLINAIVQKKINDSRRLNALFTLSVVSNALLSVGVIIVTPAIADFYGNQALTPVLLFLGIINPIMSLTVIPQATLQMNMQFKRRAMVEMCAGALSAASAFVLALLNFGIWSLLLSSALLMLARAIGMHLAIKVDYRITTKFKGLGLTDTLIYACHVQLGSIIWFIYNRADTVLLSKGLGIERAGIYNVASEIASIPMTKINAIVNEVAFSAFSKTNHDPSAMSHYLKFALRTVGVITIPVFAGISAVSDSLVLVVLGEKWKDASDIIMILAWVFPLRMQASVITNFVSASGHARFALTNTILTCVLLVCSIAIGMSFGLNAVAWAWVIGFTLAHVVIVVRVSLFHGVPFAAFFSWWPVLFISVGMFCIVHILQHAISALTGANHLSQLILSILVGVVVSAPLLLLMYSKELRQAFRR